MPSRSVLDLLVSNLMVSPTWHGPVPARSKLGKSGKLVQYDSGSMLVCGIELDMLVPTVEKSC